MKFHIVYVLIFFLTGCSFKKESVNEVVANYKLIERSDIVCFNYDPAQRIKVNQQDSYEAGFAKELLSLLDTSLTKYNYQVIRSTERISLVDKDTMSVDIYCFNNKMRYDRVASLFVDSSYIMKFIHVLKPPYYGVYFMNDSSLYAIVRQGLYHKMDLKDSSLREFISSEKEDWIRELPNIGKE